MHSSDARPVPAPPDDLNQLVAKAGGSLGGTTWNKAALLVPFSSVITTMTGSWHAVFMLAAGMAAISALLAIFVLKPMRNAHSQKHARSASLDMPYTPLKE